MTVSSLRGAHSEKEFGDLAVKFFNDNPSQNTLEAILDAACHNMKVKGNVIRHINKSITGYKILKRQGLGSEAGRYFEEAIKKGRSCPNLFIQQLSSRN